jgi:hypothetical protein
MLKAANDNVLSETAALWAQLKVASDNHAELKEEVESLKRTAGGRR